MDLLKRLDRKARRGSKPRCHWLTHGDREEVAASLSRLADPWCAITAEDSWMPDGFCQVAEACLDKSAKLLPRQARSALRDWWLEFPRGATTPTFDIASTCSIDGKDGLLLVEAKAYSEELIKETAGKSLSSSASSNSCANHRRIGDCIREASIGLSNCTGLDWGLSRDCCYQMSNRFAWSWKLTELDFPVVLVYLGFLNAREMLDRGEPFLNQAAWQFQVKAHSRSVFPDTVWESQWIVNDCIFVPCIRSLETPYNAPVKNDYLHD